MSTSPHAPVYIVKDNGKRCFAPPCDHYDLLRADQPDTVLQSIHELNLDAVTGGDAEKQAEMVRRTFSAQGLKLEGALEQRLKAGPGGDATVLRASRVIDG